MNSETCSNMPVEILRWIEMMLPKENWEKCILYIIGNNAKMLYVYVYLEQLLHE